MLISTKWIRPILIPSLIQFSPHIFVMSLLYHVLSGQNPSPMWDRLVFNKIKARLGGRVRLMSSGASPLSADVMEFLRMWADFFWAHLDNYLELLVKYNYCLNFYRCFGCEVIEGYGMTETSCIISAMNMGDKSIGHVGSPIPSCGKLSVLISRRHFDFKLMFWSPIKIRCLYVF